MYSQMGARQVTNVSVKRHNKCPTCTHDYPPGCGRSPQAECWSRGPAWWSAGRNWRITMWLCKYKQSPPSNVEGDPQPHVSTSLVQLAGQLAVCHVELGVVRNQKVMFGLIPGLDSDREARPSCPGPRGSRHTAWYDGRQDGSWDVRRMKMKPRWPSLNLVYDIRQLVDPLAGVISVHVRILGPEVSPLRSGWCQSTTHTTHLEAIDRPQVPLLAVTQAYTVQELTGTRQVRLGPSLLFLSFGICKTKWLFAYSVYADNFYPHIVYMRIIFYPHIVCRYLVILDFKFKIDFLKLKLLI